MRVAQTSFDVRLLGAMGVLVDDQVAELPALSERDLRQLVVQLRQDLDATLVEQSGGEKMFLHLAEAYRRLEDENAGLRRQLRTRGLWQWLTARLGVSL